MSSEPSAFKVCWHCLDPFLCLERAEEETAIPMPSVGFHHWWSLDNHLPADFQFSFMFMLAGGETQGLIFQDRSQEVAVVGDAAFLLF